MKQCRPYFLALLLVVALPAVAQRRPIPLWNEKKASKLIRVVQIRLINEKNEPVRNQVITADCKKGPYELHLERTTNRRGQVNFRRSIPQGWICAFNEIRKYDDKTAYRLIKRIDFSEFIPGTLSVIQLVSKQEAASKKVTSDRAVKNQIWVSKKTKAKIYLYKKGKRYRAKDLSFQLTCLSNRNKRSEKTKFKRKVFGHSLQLEIPAGSECFLDMKTSDKKFSCNSGTKALWDFSESDRTYYKEIRLHINLTPCPPPIPGGGYAIDPNGDKAGMLSDTEAEKRYKNLMWGLNQLKAQDLIHPAPAPILNPETVQENTPENTPDQNETSKISFLVKIKDSHDQPVEWGNQWITLVHPNTKKSIEVFTTASGEANLTKEQLEAFPIEENIPYSVFLGTENEPIATRNLIETIQFTTNSISKPTAVFDVGPIRVLFKNDKFDLDLKNSEMDDLNLIIARLKAIPDLRIRIEGFTDSNQSEEYNLKLSNNRSESVRKYLIESGIQEDRIEAEGFGENELILNEDGTENKTASRRVEVTPYFEQTLKENEHE